MKCGGSTKKMAKGGTVSKPFAAGIPYASGAGATDGKNGMMKKGGAVKKMQTGGIISHRNSKGISLSNNKDSDLFRNKKTGVKTMTYTKPDSTNNSKGTRTTYVDKGSKNYMKKENVNINKNPLNNVIKNYNSNSKVLVTPEKKYRDVVTPSTQLKKAPVKKMQKGGASGEDLRFRGIDMKYNGIDLKDAGTYQKELGREMKTIGKGLKAKGMVKKAEGKTLKAAGKILSKKQKGGATNFGMLSVKAGVDKNPRATAADRIAGARKTVKKVIKKK